MVNVLHQPPTAVDKLGQHWGKVPGAFRSILTYSGAIAQTFLWGSARLDLRLDLRLDIFQANDIARSFLFPRPLDLRLESGITFEAIVKVVVLVGKSDQNSRRSSVSGNQHLLRFGDLE